MEITAKMVKELRELTGAGMMDCKKALEDASGDVQAAQKALREKGIASAAKRADRSANEGLIVASNRADGKSAAIIDLRAETDFVAKNDEFVALASDILSHVAENVQEGASLDEVKAGTLSKRGETVADAVVGATAKIGEKIDLARAVVYTIDGPGLVDTYVHHTKKSGSIVAATTEQEVNKDELYKIVHEVALQVAVTGPSYLSRADIPQDEIQREIEIERNRAIEEGKPEAAADKIAQGRVEKSFIQANALLDQPYWRDDKKTVQQFVDEEAQKLGTKVTVTKFMKLSTSDEVA